MARVLIAAGIVAVLLGVLLLSGVRIPLGQLPGDLVFRRNGTTVYIPITTMLLISILLSVVLTVVARLR